MNPFKKSQAGQAALTVILLISGVIIETALGGTMIVLLLSDSGFGERLSGQAFAAAESGIQDAFLQIVGNKDTGGQNYSFSVGGGLAEISIVKASENRFNVESVGKALNRQRKLEAVLAVDPQTGKADLESIKETE